MALSHVTDRLRGMPRWLALAVVGLLERATLKRMGLAR